jgi:Flp pilus assembly protein TadB
MSEEEDVNEDKGFDKFELITAILLGLAAIGAAMAGYQSSLWGGKSTEAYSEASTIATKAAADRSHAVTKIAHDQSVDIQAKRLLVEAVDAEEDGETAYADRAYEVVSYLYTVQLGDTAYKNFKFPAENRTNKEKQLDLPRQALKDSLGIDLEQSYVDEMLATSKKSFEDSDKRFDEGRKANDIGDSFDLDGVIYTVSLFFAGIGLVFKTKIRWYFFIAGALVFLIGTAYLFKLDWA